MKIRQNQNAESGRNSKPNQSFAWKILVVDDEPGVVQVTKSNLRNFTYQGHGLEFIEAGSAKEAKEKLHQHPDISLALIDVVMEKDDAGLELVKYIRDDLGNSEMRLIIRTGQPGIVSERHVVEQYDINDFKEKTELTSFKLYSAVKFSLKDYQQHAEIEKHKQALKHIIDVTPYLYGLKADYLEDFFKWVLNQLVHVYQIAHTGMVSSFINTKPDFHGMMATFDRNRTVVQATIGDFTLNTFNPDRYQHIIDTSKKIVLDGSSSDGLRSEAVVIPLKTTHTAIGFVYLESKIPLNKTDFELTQILANQCAACLDNFNLFSSLEKNYDQSIDMLALVAEFKDQAAGGHIYRTQELTRHLSEALGLGSTDANAFARASRLHDIGKVGIPDAILSKPGKLTPEEFQVITTHTIIGDQILQNSPALEIAKIVARSHHEKWDGTGYPDGLKAHDIPLVARIVSVVDVFDALASPRPYKKPWHIDDIRAELESASGKAFDPKIITVFSRLLDNGDLDDLLSTYTQYGPSPTS
jgi:response regulator RpfG family c-di-GMP phosphodiesterase